MSYNITFTDEANTLADLVTGINANLPVLFGSIILAIIWLTFFSLTIRNGATAAFMSASLVSTLIGGLMLFAGLITWPVLVAPVIMLLMGIAYRYFNGGN